MPPGMGGHSSWYNSTMRDVHRIVDRIDQILKNERNQPLDMLGSYIVGETII